MGISQYLFTSNNQIAMFSLTLYNIKLVIKHIPFNTWKHTSECNFNLTHNANIINFKIFVARVNLIILLKIYGGFSLHNIFVIASFLMWFRNTEIVFV